MKKLFLTLALTSTTIFVRASEVGLPSSAPAVTGPLAMLPHNSGANTPCHSLSNLSSPKSNQSTPGHSRRPSMSLVLPALSTPAKTTTGFAVAAPLTPPSSTTNSPRTPAIQEVVAQPVTPISAKEWTEKTTAAFNLSVAAYNQQQVDQQRRRFSPIQECGDRTELQQVVMTWMSPEEEQKTVRVLEATIGDQL